MHSVVEAGGYTVVVRWWLLLPCSLSLVVTMRHPVVVSLGVVHWWYAPL